jgi:2-methylcitrate dehydratase PrpD
MMIAWIFPRSDWGIPRPAFYQQRWPLAKYHLSGQDLLAAYCLGIEAYAKIGLLAKRLSNMPKAGNGQEFWGVMGATAAVTKLMRLDENQTVTGFGIAASLSSGLTRNFGSMAGHLHAGNAARNAVEAGFLASQGYTAYNGIIEGPSGFYNTLTANTNPVSQEAMQENLNALGNLEYSKSRDSCLGLSLAHISHFGVDMRLQLRKNMLSTGGNRGNRISRSIYPEGRYFHREPQTGVEGKFSFGYCNQPVLIYGDKN